MKIKQVRAFEIILNPRPKTKPAKSPKTANPSISKKDFNLSTLLFFPNIFLKLRIKVLAVSTLRVPEN